jgi:hypothetical protein
MPEEKIPLAIRHSSACFFVVSEQNNLCGRGQNKNEEIPKDDAERKISAFQPLH